MKYRNCLLLILCLLAANALADKPYYILDPVSAGVALQSEIKSPGEFLGFNIGERAIRHGELVAYLRYLAGSSDRVELAKYSTTLEGRGLDRLGQHLSVCRPGRTAQSVSAGSGARVLGGLLAESRPRATKRHC